MSVVTISPEALAIDKCAHLLALTPTLRAGRSWQTTLADSISYWARETDDDIQRPERPFWTIDYAGGTEWELDAGGEFNSMRPSGQLFVGGEFAWPAAYRNDVANAMHLAGNYFTGVIQELTELAGVDVSQQIGKVFQDESASLSIIRAEEQYLRRADPDDWAPSDWYFDTGYLISWGDG